MSGSMSAPSRSYYKVKVNKVQTFQVDVRYQNLEVIGSGSYGLVCSATDTVLNQKVAIKKVADMFQDLVDAKRILREIKLLRHLDGHQNVVGIRDLMTNPPDVTNFDDVYIVTDLFECDLDRIISSTQPLTDAHAQYFIYQVLRGMKFIHTANVLHRDMKPSNLLVNSNCDLAICDFGLARGIHGGGSEDTGAAAGEGSDAAAAASGGLTEYVVTRWYRAPELLCDNRTYGKKVDVWSCGCILGELFQRKPLLPGRDYLHQLNLIVNMIGTPEEDDMRHLIHEGAKRALRGMRGTKKDLSTIFPRASADALDLLAHMLVFDEEKRYSIEECLRHPYLSELHCEPQEPSCGSSFDFSFEDGYPEEMPRDMIQGHIFKEMCDLFQKNERSK
jgi:mitogen-activated protein kinase 1/3